MAVEAQLITLPSKSGRKADRREVRLRGHGATAPGEAIEVLIHNLSETGLLLETAAILASGEEIAIDLPDLERISATVVWSSEGLFGCSFASPVPRAKISAAQLRSMPKERSPESPTGEAREKRPMVEEAFGARLRRLRHERGLSLVEFAQRMNVSRPTVWSWEAGRSLPRSSKLPSLLEVLAVSESDLLGMSDELLFGSAAGRASAPENALQTIISNTKSQIAEIVGTSPDRVKLVIEV